jgi:hypothetical protein
MPANLIPQSFIKISFKSSRLSCITASAIDITLAYRYVPRKPRLVCRDESAQNEISFLISGMPLAVRGASL